MAEEEEKKSGSDSGFLLLFFGGLFAFWFLAGAGEGPGLFNTATTTDEVASSTIGRDVQYEDPNSRRNRRTASSTSGY